MAAADAADKVEPADSEQDEEEDVYEVERIIDMREEQGEVLYRVRWKNYCSDDDTWEPEAHLEDCHEVLLAFKKNIVEAKAKKEAEAKKIVKPLPVKTEVFDADSESDSDKERPAPLPVKKKKKKKIREEDESPPKEKEKEKEKEKKKKKKEKRKEEVRPQPAPESDEEEEEKVPTPPSPTKEKKADLKKRLMDSEEEDDEPVPSKKQRKEKGKEVKKDKKEKAEEGKKKKGKKDKKIETSEDEAAAPLEDDLSEGPSEPQVDDSASRDAVKSFDKVRLDDKSKEKRGKWEVKLQGIKDIFFDKKVKKTDVGLKESSLQKLKSLTSKGKEESAPHSDSSDSSALHKKVKSKGQESTSAPAKVAASSSSTSSSASSVPAVSSSSSTKVKEDEVAKEEVASSKDSPGSANLFEKFLLNCEAKDRAPRRQPVPEKSVTKPTKVIGKIEKIPKVSKESPAQKAESEKTERTKQSDASRPSQSYGFSLDSDEREAEETAVKPRAGEDSRERRERQEEPQRPSWEKRTPTDDKKKRREDSEPRLFMACEENQETQETLEGTDKSEKGQATLSLGMDLNLDWMTLDDFQKHLNGEDEILSGPPLSPSELRDAVKCGDYMAVKLALNSKEDYNLDQEDVSGMSLTMLAAAGGQDDILRLLIKKGVRVNGRQKNGSTALMHAAEKNFLTTVAILLEAGSYANAQALTGETALMKACKRGNADIVRLLLEYGADCNILSKHKNSAMYYAKLGNNLMVCDLIKDHINTLSSVAEDTIRGYFESRLQVLEPVFPLACHRLCEGPDFSMEFAFKAQPQPEGSGILLFIFHANFHNEVIARLCGPCSVHAVVLNDKFQLPIFLDSHFIYSFNPIPGINRLFIRLAEAPTAKVKLLICAYKVQLQ
ncbi:M-phase phosphoprotein 8 isoform X3 [Solea senegalensis]|uniref:M-phase phosphoprotein 8 isoform X3 n=2 Tax=Solea senegalensis TaxID=28829 RepID=A0AAV6RC00_SOLSE|nr:M-phase phosphoprotein 8 isoform X3 [Solea senegalensis]KAG7501482.1 M-phase phosphoprotein 8 isoform X3 [Solea senegalensis]